MNSSENRNCSRFPNLFPFIQVSNVPRSFPKTLELYQFFELAKSGIDCVRPLSEELPSHRNSIKRKDFGDKFDDIPTVIRNPEVEYIRPYPNRLIELQENAHNEFLLNTICWIYWHSFWRHFNVPVSFLWKGISIDVKCFYKHNLLWIYWINKFIYVLLFVNA